MFQDLYCGRTALLARHRSSHMHRAQHAEVGTEFFIELEPRTLFSSVGVSEFRLNTTTGDQQQAVTVGGIAHSVAGGGVAVWQSYNQDVLLTWGVYGQRFGSDGSAIGSEFLVNTASLLNDQQRPTVAMNDDGDFVVAWDGSGLLGLFPGIYVQRYASDGSAIGGAIGVAGSVVLDVRNASIGMDSSGGFVVAYEGNDVGLSRGIYVRRYDSSGTAQGAAVVVNTTTAGSQTDPQIIVAPNGSFVVAWEGSGTGDGTGVFARLYAADGTAITGEVRLNQITAGTQGAVSLALIPAGFVAAWAGSGTEDGSGVYVRRFDDTGTALAGQVLVNVTTAGTQAEPSVAADPDGDFVVAWSGAGTPDGAGIYFREFAADGAARGGETLVNTTTAGTQGRPSVSSQADNGYAINWGGNGTGDAAGVFAAFLINDPSAVTTSVGSASFIENGTGTTIDSGLTISDTDDTLLEGATVHIANFVSGQDQLLFTDQAGIVGSWDSATGTLTLTGLATVAAYQAALRSVSYRNTSDNPDTTTRSVQFSVSDGVDWSTVAARSISVTAVNDAPTLSTSGGAASFIENGSAAVVDTGLVLGDVDNAALTSAIVTITNFAAGEDQLIFTDQGGISGSWNAISGTLTLTGSATVAAYQAALRTVSYRNTSDNPDVTTRSVQFQASDGLAWSSTASRGVLLTAVNDAPAASTSSGSAAFIENGAPAAIDPGLLLSDLDNSSLSAAAVTIANYVAGQDQLLFTNQSGITGSWDATSGTLSLTGTASLAAYQAALRSVTYQNTSENPDVTTRTVQFAASDGTDWSVGASRNVALTAINDAPNLSTSGGSASFIENGSPVTIDPGLTILDVDNTTLTGAIISITTFVAGQDQLLFTNQSGITGSWDALNGALTLTGVATLAAYQAALRSITYLNTSDDPDTTTRSVVFTVSDGADSSPISPRNVSVTAVNDAPNVVTSGGAAAFIEGGLSATVDPGLILADVDSPLLAGAVVTITNFTAGEDQLLFVDQGGITGIWDGVTGALTLSGTASIAAYQSALRSITYRNLSENPDITTRTVQFQVSDGAAWSIVASRGVALTAINDVPTVSMSGGTATFIENGVPQAVDSGLLLGDADNSTLAGATVTIANFIAGEDQLLFTNQGGISGSWNAVTGILTLTGTASLAAYQNSLRSVTYLNTSENPDTTPRSVQIVVSDGVDVSLAAARSVNVTTVNDAPAAVTSGGTAAFIENGTSVAVDPGLLLVDPDNSSLSGAVITITNFIAGEDQLLFTDQAGITGAWDPVAGTLTLSGTAAISVYQTALGSIAYRNISEDPDTTPRSVQFVVTDGTDSSAPSVRSVTVAAVNDLPVVTTSPGSVTFIENATVLVIDAGITITDVDSSLLTGAMVTIVNFVPGEDELLFTDQGGISGSWDALTGQLTLTGMASIAAYQAALRSITYRNTSDDPSAATRSIEFAVSDGVGASAAAARSLNVAAVNDAPAIVTSLGSAAFIEGGPAVTIDPGVLVTDADDSFLNGASVTITNFIPGQDELLFTAQGGITGLWDAATGVLTLSGAASVSAYAAALRSVTYINTSDDPDTAPRSIQFTVIDSGGTANSSTRSVSVTAVNDAPAITPSAGTTSFVENGPAVTIDPGLLLADSDSSVLSGAVITLSNFRAGEDMLVFTDQSGITGIWDGTTGVLTLSGSALLAAYQSALRSITYRNTSEAPDTTTRTAQFSVYDSIDWSLPSSRGIIITAINDVPTLTNSGGSASFVENGVPIVVDPGLLAADADSTILNGATVSITNYVSAEDRLLFTDQSGISGSWNGATGILTLSGLASLAAYQAALASITYRNTSDAPDTASRTIQFQVSDGSAWSVPVVRSVTITAINDAPTLSTSPGAALYIENAAPARIDPALQLSDPDGSTLTGATISILNFIAAEDQLIFTDQSGIVGAWDAAAGVLSLTGTATIAAYQAALRSVAYLNTSEDPDAAPRTVLWIVTDGADSSTPVSRPVNIISLPETPVVIVIPTPPAQFINPPPPPANTPATIPVEIPVLPPLEELPFTESRPDESAPASAPSIPKSTDSPALPEAPAAAPESPATARTPTPTPAPSSPASASELVNTPLTEAAAPTQRTSSDQPPAITGAGTISPARENGSFQPPGNRPASSPGNTVILVPYESARGEAPSDGGARTPITDAAAPRAVTVGIVVTSSIVSAYGVWIILGLVSARSAYNAVQEIHEFDVVEILKQWNREQFRTRLVRSAIRLVQNLARGLAGGDT